jgi:hypothetical protein
VTVRELCSKFVVAIFVENKEGVIAGALLVKASKGQSYAIPSIVDHV